MSTTTGEIQPILSVPWVAQETQPKEAQSVPPVIRAEGGSAPEVGDFGANSGANFSAPPPEFSAEVVEQIQFFLKENMGIELNFIADADGRTVVEVLDSNAGKVIRRMPPEKVSLFCNKIEKLRGILFDGQA
ncbi:MAG: flagellar protein FlaG [Syntrophobacteraceae bacterium]